MNDDNHSYAEQIALFRYGVIADLLHRGPDGTGEDKKLAEHLRAKAARRYTIPRSRRTRIAAQTMRDWLRAYQRGGFDALRPRARKDAGATRKIPQAVADLLVQIKDEHRDYSIAMVIARAQQQSEQARGVTLPLSTVHRLLSRAGVIKPEPTAPSSKDRRRFSFQRAGQMWMSDVMHGPAVMVDGQRKRKAYLIALIDDATRMVPFCQFALAETTEAFLPVLHQGIIRRGIPQRLYVDNGAAYRSKHLALVCAKLGITLIHARPYQPAGKGKQERWFRTVRMQLLPTLTATDLRSLDALNRRLWAWVEGEYHRCPHRGLDGQTPMDAWALRSGDVRLCDSPTDLHEVFLFEQKRRVHKDRTVSLRGTLYEVDASLVGYTVLLRYDPAQSSAPVDVWFEGKKVGQATVVDAYANCFVKRHRDRVNTVVINPDADIPPSALRMRELHHRPRIEKEG